MTIPRALAPLALIATLTSAACLPAQDYAIGYATKIASLPNATGQALLLPDAAVASVAYGLPHNLAQGL